MWFVGQDFGRDKRLEPVVGWPTARVVHAQEIKQMLGFVLWGNKVVALNLNRRAIGLEMIALTQHGFYEGPHMRLPACRVQASDAKFPGCYF